MEQIAQYDNCKTAITDALKDKNKKKRSSANDNHKSRNKNKRRIIKIKAHLKRTAWRLKTVLEGESYKAPKMHEFHVRDGANNKLRHITAPDLHSQFVHHAVFNVVGQTIERRNYFYDCGNMPRKGQSLAIKRTKALFRDKRNKYYAQFDVSKYYDSIPHKSVIWLLRNRITKDKPTLRLLWKIIKSSGKCGRGLAIGFYSSQYLAVLFLQDLDYKITQKYAPGCGYVRYVDDGVITGSNKRVLRRTLDKIAEYLQMHGLHIKGVWAVRRISDRLMLFLGLRFGRGYTIMGKALMYRISRAARYAANRKPTLHRAAQLLSYWGTLKMCDSYHFRQKHFDPNVSIKNCKEVISNACKQQYLARAL